MPWSTLVVAPRCPCFLTPYRRNILSREHAGKSHKVVVFQNKANHGGAASLPTVEIPASPSRLKTTVPWPPAHPSDKPSLQHQGRKPLKWPAEPLLLYIQEAQSPYFCTT